MGNQRAKAASILLFTFWRGNPPDERKEGEQMVTYSDLVQTGLFIIALIGLCYTVFRGKK